MSNRWSLEESARILQQPFPVLLDQAHQVHKKHFDPTEIQISVLLNIKTGNCPENCAYCPQSARYNTGLERAPLMGLEEIRSAAKAAKDRGATRFCMGAAWRGPKAPDLEKVCAMIGAVKELGLESCVTLGMLKEGQAQQLKTAGLDYYNHNIDTSPTFYPEIISSHTFEDRLHTLAQVQAAGLQTCCGGILGLGESREDRLQMLLVLANMATPPESVPINRLIPIPGTPLAQSSPIDPFDFIRTIALARIMLPKSFVRLSAGRGEMSDEMQALCFFAGANSIHYGEKLLVTANPTASADDQLFTRLGLHKMSTLPKKSTTRISDVVENR